MWSDGQSQALVALPVKARHGSDPRVSIAGVPTEIHA